MIFNIGWLDLLNRLLIVVFNDVKMASNDLGVVCRLSFKQMMLSRSGSFAQNLIYLHEMRFLKFFLYFFI